MENFKDINTKILLVREGYLSNYPYHMIAKDEMCNAFLSLTEDGQGMFYYMYPLIDETLSEQYDTLVSAIKYHLQNYISVEDYILPDWVYSYMLGSTISSVSNKRDIHDLLVLLNLDNIDDVFTAQAALSCYEISKKWIEKLQNVTTVTYNNTQISDRPPTIFGEPHVIKSLRLMQVDIK